MRAPDVAVLVLTGAALVGFALASLKPASALRRAYRIPVDDDAAARSNAAVVAVVGVGLWLLAAAVVADVPERVIGAATVLASAGLCLALGWLVRHRGRHELLTVPDPDPDTARRLGGAATVCGVLLLPLAAALWLGAGDTVVTVLTLGGSLLALVAAAVAAR